MRLRRTFTAIQDGCPVTVIFHSSSARSANGKFLVGACRLDPRHTVIVFDESATFHKDIALAHRLHPRGGGLLRADFRHKTLEISGRSQAYGLEPDRALTLRALSALFPDFHCRTGS